MRLNGSLLGSLFVGVICGVYSVLVDCAALINYDWGRGFPGYMDLLRSPHRYTHTALFAWVSFFVVFAAVASLLDG